MSAEVDLYGAAYRGLANELYTDIRREAFGEDIGQTGWLTADEHDLFISWLALTSSSAVLDLACGTGRPTLRLAEKTSCRVVGLDLHSDGIANAQISARARSHLSVSFFEGDAAKVLPFEPSTFDAIICIDAINHLPNRQRVLTEWGRVLKPGGRLLFTDPIVLTGLITNQEIAIRASIGLFVFAPKGLDEVLLQEAGFYVERLEDRTRNMAENASGWHAARERRSSDLRDIEGDATFEGQQRFLETTALLAKERRLSRVAILARKC